MSKYNLLLLSSMALLLTGCLNAVRTPDVNYYTLNPGKLNIVKGKTNQKTLMVQNTRANSAYDTINMAYSTHPYQLSYFSKNQWVAKPAEQLTNLIAQSLRQGHRFRAVVTPPFIGTVNYRLNTHLYYLKQNFRTKLSHVQLSLSAQLTNANTGKVIASRTFTIRRPALGNNPRSGAVAANQAVRDLLIQLNRFVNRSL